MGLGFGLGLWLGSGSGLGSTASTSGAHSAKETWPSALSTSVMCSPNLCRQAWMQLCRCWQRKGSARLRGCQAGRNSGRPAARPYARGLTRAEPAGRSRSLRFRQDGWHRLEHSELVELPLVVRRHWRTSEALVATAQPSLAGSVTSGAAGGCSAGGGAAQVPRRAPSWRATSRLEIRMQGRSALL